MRITRPRPGEPIRLVDTKHGPRYKVVLDVGLRPDGRRRQVQKTFTTIRAARDFVTATRADLTKGTYVAPERETFDQVADRWLASKRDVRAVTVGGYRQALKPVQKLIGGRPVQSLSRRDVEGVVQHLVDDGGLRGTRLSRRSVVYSLTTVRQVFGYAVTEGLIAVNPALSVKPPRQQSGDKSSVTVWEPSELAAFKTVADTDVWAAGWRLTLCGLRRSEVLGLSWDAVDLDQGTVTVKAGRVALDGSHTATDDPKSSASRRTVPVESMHPGTVALLRGLRVVQARDRLAAGSAYEDNGYVLVDALGRPVRPEAYSDRFAVLCGEAGVPVVRLHAVRHTIALMLHRIGVAPADAAALLGHTVAVHLSTYVPRTERGVSSAAAALGEVMAAVP